MLDLRPKFVSLSVLAKNALAIQDVTLAIADLALEALSNLSKLQKIKLDSSIAGKDYFVFNNDGKFSRPINTALFNEDYAIENIEKYKNFDWLSLQEHLQTMLYTLGMSYCAATDVLGKNDRKTPSVFF